MNTAATTSSGLQSSGSSGSDAKDELQSDAARLKESAKHRASDEAEKQKSQAAQTARSASDALEKAAGELDGDRNAPDWLTAAFRETAKGIDRFAGQVDGRSPEQMSRDVRRFAREHPTSFLAASAAAGFAAARFLRAGADYRQHDHGDESTFGTAETPTYGTADVRTERTAFTTDTGTARTYDESRGGMSR